MPFFEPPSPPPGGGPRDVEPPLPEWFGPPEHVLGTPVGVRAVLVHRPDLAIAAPAFRGVPDLFRFGVVIADGGRATTVDVGWHLDPQGDAQPAPPVLMMRDGAGDDRGWSLGFWLWPPPRRRDRSI